MVCSEALFYQFPYNIAALVWIFNTQSTAILGLAKHLRVLGVIQRACFPPHPCLLVYMCQYQQGGNSIPSMSGGW